MDFSEEELIRLEAMSVYEKQLKEGGFLRIVGVDEAGRGPIAGPVVAAACMLPEGALFSGLNDSKQLRLKQREALFQALSHHPGVLFGIGEATVLEIDQYNILQATFLAMKRAVQGLSFLPEYLLIDGNQKPVFEVPSQTIIKGDSRSVSIAAASILAKVTRDRLMVSFDKQWPQYGFKEHKGYGTKKHLQALAEYGPCPLHRRSFDPLRSKLEEPSFDHLPFKIFSH